MAMGLKPKRDFRVIKSPDAKIEIVGCGEIIFGSMDTPELIIGYEHADAFLDELDTLTPLAASQIWKKILAAIGKRNRTALRIQWQSEQLPRVSASFMSNGRRNRQAINTS
jgi:hypothetical protein